MRMNVLTLSIKIMFNGTGSNKNKNGQTSIIIQSQYEMNKNKTRSELHYCIVYFLFRSRIAPVLKNPESLDFNKADRRLNHF